MSQMFGQDKPMNDHIRTWIKEAEKREIALTGLNKPEARERLAGKLKIGYWSLTNIIRGRIKWSGGNLRDKIKAGIIRNLEAEIGRLESELEVVRKCNSGLPDANILAAQAAIEQARAFLRGDRE